MRIIIVLFSLFLVSCFGTKGDFLQSESIQLSKPLIECDQMFFEDKAQVNIGSTNENALIVYSTDKSEPYQKYKGALTIDQSTMIYAKAISKKFEDSDEVSLRVVKLPSNKIQDIITYRSPSPTYSKGGNSILIDQVKGGSNFRERWLGYEGDSVSYSIAIDKQSINKVIVSCLREQGAWIFGPSTVRVKHMNKVIAEKTIEDCTHEQANSNLFLELNFSAFETGQLTVEVIAPNEIPAWHPGKGSKPWLFIDEILIY